ncbi:MAG: hypothetical protein IPK26_24960 [Planctomycetes bacterium]|nr:hypothetical protein [Planctomycetota bacterium]
MNGPAGEPVSWVVVGPQAKSPAVVIEPIALPDRPYSLHGTPWGTETGSAGVDEGHPRAGGTNALLGIAGIRGSHRRHRRHEV